ncbi:MAG: hypothetical protein JWO94_2500, partial [Verrucomicrobiaceae bacterium]|nr:hypothetical protein [Verrucomicrobiaceae bacterium]
MTAKPVDRVDELLDHPQFPRFKEWVIRRTGLSYYEDKDRDLALAVQRWWQHRPGISATELLDPAEDPTRAPPDALVEELT